MSFNPDAVNTIDQNTVENDGPQYPIIQWVYGDPKQKKAGGMDYQGGFFIAEDSAPEDLTQYGWERESWMHGDGSETDGFYCRLLNVSVVQMRKRWEVYSGGRRYTFAWNDYDKASEVGRPAGRTHVLCIVQGMEELGPFIITLKGMAAMHFEGTRNTRGILRQFSGTVIAAANAMSKKGRWPYRAFWLGVQAAQDGKGNPTFTEVGRGNDTSNVVLPVAVNLPDKAKDVDLNDFYVGDDVLAQVNDLWTENVEWAKAWDTIEPGTTEGESQPDDEEVEDEVTPEAAAAIGL